MCPDPNESIQCIAEFLDSEVKKKAINLFLLLISLTQNIATFMIISPLTRRPAAIWTWQSQQGTTAEMPDICWSSPPSLQSLPASAAVCWEEVRRPTLVSSCLTPVLETTTTSWHFSMVDPIGNYPTSHSLFWRGGVSITSPTVWTYKKLPGVLWWVVTNPEASILSWLLWGPQASIWQQQVKQF